MTKILGAICTKKAKKGREKCVECLKVLGNNQEDK